MDKSVNIELNKKIETLKTKSISIDLWSSDGKLLATAEDDLKVIFQFKYIVVDSDKRRLKSKCDVWRESTVGVIPTMRRKGISRRIYQYITEELNVNIMSDDIHYDDSFKLWQSFYSVKSLNMYIVDTDNFDLTEYTPDAINTYGDNLENIRLVLGDKKCALTV